MKLAVWLLLPGLAWCQNQPEKAKFEGQVINGISGEPVRKARLTLRMSVALQAQRQQQAAPASPVTVVTDNAGKFAFLDVEPGSYQMTVRRDGFENVQFGLRDGSKTAEPILLGPGDHKVEFTVKMTPYGAISGKITDEEGDPIRNLQVAAMVYRYTTRGRELGESKTASTNDLGEYRIYDVPPGRYYIKASPGQMRAGSGPEDTDFFAPAYYPGSPDARSAAALDLSAGQQLTGLNLALRKMRLATIRGKLIFPPGATNVSIGRMVVSDNGSSMNSSNLDDKEGKFQLFGLTPGKIYVVGSYVVEGRRYSAQMPVEVGTSDISGIELRPAPPFEVTGSVRIEGTSDRKPSQVQVSLQGPGRSYGAESSLIRDDGTLTFRGVEANLYKVNLGQTGGLYLKSIHWGPTDITDSDLDLTFGVPPRTELAVVLGADGGDIEGVVKNEKSEPAENAMVTLVPTSGHKSRPFYRTARADATGHFSIRAIAPGSYKLFAWDKVDANAVIFDPDFLRPYEAAGQSAQVVPSDKKNIELKMIVNQTK